MYKAGERLLLQEKNWKVAVFKTYPRILWHSSHGEVRSMGFLVESGRSIVTSL